MEGRVNKWDSEKARSEEPAPHCRQPTHLWRRLEIGSAWEPQVLFVLTNRLVKYKKNKKLIGMGYMWFHEPFHVGNSRTVIWKALSCIFCWYFPHFGCLNPHLVYPFLFGAVSPIFLSVDLSWLKANFCWCSTILAVADRRPMVWWSLSMSRYLLAPAKNCCISFHPLHIR